MNIARVRQLNAIDQCQGNCVIYWMSRDQRIQDNWALHYAQDQAIARGVPLVVVFAVSRQFLGATRRHYRFMLEGIAQVQRDLGLMQIPLFLLEGDRKLPEMVLDAIAELKPSLVITDFSPLRVGRQWREFVAQQAAVAVYEVDAHNIVPAWVISDHQEFAAHTIRPKLHHLVDQYLAEIPTIRRQETVLEKHAAEINVERVLSGLTFTDNHGDDVHLPPGEKAGLQMLELFINQKMERYATERNMPTVDMQSNLSPYLHYGQISAQRIAAEVMAKTGKRLQAKLAQAEHSAEAFLEELIVRRELADNFCLYNKSYDSFEGAPEWAKRSLLEHLDDHREKVYTLEEFESGLTHDNAWNAAQHQMVYRGKMHGYMRMYWAKKMLEWSPSPQKAVEWAVYLNDKYEFDGRDPNGYAGIMWSICGVHDRPWFERPVFGKIRYMGVEGLKKRFDLAKYVEMNMRA